MGHLIAESSNSVLEQLPQNKNIKDNISKKISKLKTYNKPFLIS